MRLPLFSALLVSVALLPGCGMVNPALDRAATPMVQAKAVPTTKAEFVAAVAKLGVKLTEDQLAIIHTDRTMVPNGQWAPRPAENLTAAENLTVHFLKHGREFHPAIGSEQGYLQQAMDLAAGKRGAIEYYFDTTSFAKGYQSHVVRWNHTTREMTAMRQDGAMTTYYLNNTLAANRFVVVPLF